MLLFSNTINICLCTDRNALPNLTPKPSSFYAINTYHNIYEELKEFTYESIVNFVAYRDLHKKLPLAAAYDFVIEKELPAVYLFINENSFGEYMKIINDTLTELENIRIVFGDLNVHSGFSKIIGVSPSSQPMFMLIEPVGTSLKKFIHNSSGISKKNILELISLWKDNKAKRFYKSTTPVKGELVGSNFERIIAKTYSDTLVHFYAPWCNHCKELGEILKNLENKIANLKVYSINAFDNDIPGHHIDEYPTLKFYYPVTEKWFTFTKLAEDGSGNSISRRIVDFMKSSIKDKKSSIEYDNEDL